MTRPCDPSPHQHPDSPAPNVFTTDPVAGLDARPQGLRAPLEAGHSGSEHGGGFVRPARDEDLPAIGAIHAVTMQASLEAAHDSAHGAPLPESVRAMISAPVITAGWQEAVTSPPSPGHHVLVATQDDQVVGLLGLAPTQSVAAPEGGADAPALKAGEVTALGVGPDHQLRGHGSRLLAAAVDLARQDGAQVLVAWSVRGDESLTRLFQAVGMAPTGAQRELPVGQGVVEECWAASL